ncbi:MAG TPA: hypothetical protein G4O04_04655 [Anaerolineae bacterium]|nr:hypothetical protein [Anaerolineae bacterium]HID85091.1 hypothetical protein [Anaerolineales bacterium]HIQ08748.1 hypothetical protein [Anaerolineaceae bacterium]
MSRRAPLTTEEMRSLEDWLRQDLVPVSPDPQFVGRTYTRLQNPRAVQVPWKSPATMRQGLLVVASLSGALFALALVVGWVFWRRRRPSTVTGA